MSVVVSVNVDLNLFFLRKQAPWLRRLLMVARPRCLRFTGQRKPRQSHPVFPRREAAREFFRWRTLPSLESRRRPRHPYRRCGQSHDLGGPARHRLGRTFLRRCRRTPRRWPDAGQDSLARLSRRLRSRERQNPFFNYLPDNGESDRKLAVAHGDGWRVPPRPASFFAVNAADAAWVDRQCTMHPLSSFEAPAQISDACDGIANIGYIRASGFESPFGQFYAKAGERGWWREELACGHDVMLDMPNELTALLLQRT